MTIKYYSLKQTMQLLNKHAKDIGLENNEILKWIVVKTLRLTIDQFDDIKQIEQEQLEMMKEYVTRYK